MVCDGIEVKTQFAMSAIPPGVEVTRRGQDQGVVLSTGDGGHLDVGQTGQRMGGGGLEDPVAQPKLTVAGQTPGVDPPRLGESEAVVAATGHPHHGLWDVDLCGLVSVLSLVSQTQFASVSLAECHQPPVLCHQSTVIVATRNVNYLNNNF